MPPIRRPDWVLNRRRQIGHHIATLRIGRGMTVDGLAEASGLDRKTVMRAEHATRSVGLDVLLQLAHGLDVPIDQLVYTPRPPQ
ncbi:helix-turn-helix domain-containing protein [Streptomyces sp.]|uniref:helix-turn-helix domain-containing protein n=1 Tax=Streptomyces sp. TaxID=1931 RepID=UPI002F40456A